MTSTLTLPEKADTSAAALLLARIMSQRGQDLKIDASKCQVIGALCAGILVSACQSWKREALHFEILNARKLAADMKLLGVNDLLFGLEAMK